ncbi:MAG: magnesium chelatase subunit H [Dethiobacter sp.]|jgi:cobaltochelatase CobN|nr:MAG: magnesium chelatase subunit H [Dethiobacter sp.]
MSNRVRITMITNASSLSSLPQVLKEIKQEYGQILELKVYPVHEIDEELVEEEKLVRDLKASDIILMDIRSNGRSLQLVKKVSQETASTVIPLLGGSPEMMKLARLGSFSMKNLPHREGAKVAVEIEYRKIQKMTSLIEKIGKFLPFGAIKHARNWVLAVKYWSHSGKENIKNLLLFVSREYGGTKVFPDPPRETPEYGIYHPVWEKFFNSYEEYAGYALKDKNKPTVGILYYGGIHYDSSAVGATALIRELEKRDINVLPVITSGVLNLEPAEKIFLAGGERRIDALVSLIWFRLNGGPLGGDPSRTAELLNLMNIPFFTPATMYSREIEKWQDSPAGISPVETLATVTFPELDGAIEPVPLFGLQDLEDGLALKVTSEIPGRAAKIAGRLSRRLDLARKPGKDKRIAFIIYNYPPGEDNLGGGAYLDTFASLENILKALGENGYRVEIPQEGLKEAFLNKGLVNSGSWISQEITFKNAVSVSLHSYLKYFKQLPGELQKDMINDWGNPPGEIMVREGQIMIPGIILGNIFVGLQPSRGIHEDQEKSYHDKALPPHHQYLAFYKYLEEEFKADAVMHIGTHGTLEFLPGKELGMSGKCYPDLFIGEMPHFYLYHVTNPSEAMIAKRRSYATIINYPSPPFTTSQLYGRFLHLEDLIAEYQENLASGDEARAERVKERIKVTAGELNLETADPGELHRELFAMKRAIIPEGLHIFGRNFGDEDTVKLLTFMSRSERSGVPSLHCLLAEAGGLKYEECLQGKNGNGLEEAERKAVLFWQALLPVLKAGLPEESRLEELAGKYILQKPDLEKVLAYYGEVVRKIMKSDGLKNLLEALDGKFVSPNIAGDPLRTPEVFPTGSNSYQFDPRLIPTDTAYARGREIAENTLQAFYAENGRYPQTVGVVLWGFETAKTRGESVGQILAYLGLKLIHGRSWYPAIEVIPLEELKRPRIDVNVNICGFFRDLFPNLVKTLDDGFRLAAELEEPEEDNYIKKHTREICASLEKDGEEKTLARKLAGARLFGPRPGEYGTNLTGLIETANWEKETELSSSYRACMGHIYGLNIHGEKADKVFKNLLSRTELVSQVRDTHEYEITDLDHYYEFFGGLSRAVEEIRGEKPRMLFSDTTGEIVSTVKVSQAIKRGINTRLLNPLWIKGLLKHDYHGAQKVSDRVEYLIGLAATVGVESKTFSRVADGLLFNPEILEALKKNNPFATQEMTKRLMEAVKRGYWEATEEELEKLRDLYLQIEGDLEERMD